jgi:hypothetical protein
MIPLIVLPVANKTPTLNANVFGTILLGYRQGYKPGIIFHGVTTTGLR